MENIQSNIHEIVENVLGISAKVQEQILLSLLLIISIWVFRKVVNKFIDQLRRALSEKNVTLQISAAAKKMLARKGYDPVFGARPLDRLIQTEISDVIASEILFGKLSDGWTQDFVFGI